MERELDNFSARPTWITADSSEQVSISYNLQGDNPVSKPLYLDKKCFSVVDCDSDDKWKQPDSSVMTSAQELTSQGNDCIQVKEEAPDKYSLPSLTDCQLVRNLQNDSPVIVNSSSNFDQNQEVFPALETQMLPYSPNKTFQKSPDDSTVCEECGKNFSCKRSYRRHMLVHSGDRPYNCKDCGRAFSRKDSLLAHERRHRRRTTHFRYHCQYCGINFLNSLQLHTHMQMHESSTSSSVQKEPEGLKDITVVTTPPSAARPSTNTYEHITQSNSSLSPQNNLSADKKVYKCSFCRKLFGKQYALHYHMKTHTPMSSCEYCGKVFRFRRNKQIHVIKCHNSFQCKRCQTNYPTYETLRNHQILYCNNGNMKELVSPSLQKLSDTVDIMHPDRRTYFLNNGDPLNHNVVASEHQTLSTQSSSDGFYALSDGNVSSLTSSNEVLEVSLPGGGQKIEVCPVQETENISNCSDESNSVLKCNICKSRLREPRTLPCTHSFCHTCLDSCLDKCTSSLICPTCQLVLVLPEDGLVNIQANQMISSLLSEIEKSEQQLFPVCIVCEESASHHCQQCDAFICIKCSNAHLKLPATKDHTQISLAEYNSKDPRERMAKTVVMCKEHGSPSQFFCNSCQKLICVGCTLVAHPKGNEHEIIDLASAFQSFCSETEPMIMKCEEREKALCSTIDEMKPILQIGHQMKYSCRESIRSYIAKLKYVVDQLQDKLLHEVDDLTNAKQMAIDSKMASLKRELEDINGTKVLAQQLISSPSNALALTMSSDVLCHLKALLHKSLPTSYTEAKKALKFVASGDLLELIQQKGIGSLEEEVQECEQKDEVIMIE